MLRVHFFYNWMKFDCARDKIIAKQWFVKSIVRNNNPLSVSESVEIDSKTIAERREMLSKYAAILVESSCSSRLKYEGSMLAMKERINILVCPLHQD